MKKYLFVLLLPIILLFPGLPQGTVHAEEGEEAAEQVQSADLNILMYHHISKSANRLNKFTVLPSDFESDVVELKARGYSFVLMQDLIDFVKEGVPLPAKPVMLTFDDGYLSFYEYAYPILQRHNAKAVCSVIGTYSELYTSHPDPNVNYAHMTWPQISELNSSPLVEIQNHTYDMHKRSPRNGAAKKSGETVSAYQASLYDDIGKLQSVLMEKCGFAPTTFTYPFGFVSKESLDVIKGMGFSASLTCWEGVNRLTRDPGCLYGLRRYNRPSRIDFKAFMNRIEKNK